MNHDRSIVCICDGLAGKRPQRGGAGEDATENGVFINDAGLNQRLMQSGGSLEQTRANSVHAPARLFWTREQTQHGGVQTVAGQHSDRIGIDL